MLFSLDKARESSLSCYKVSQANNRDVKDTSPHLFVFTDLKIVRRTFLRYFVLTEKEELLRNPHTTFMSANDKKVCLNRFKLKFPKENKVTNANDLKVSLRKERKIFDFQISIGICAALDVAVL